MEQKKKKKRKKVVQAKQNGERKIKTQENDVKESESGRDREWEK